MCGMNLLNDFLGVSSVIMLFVLREVFGELRKSPTPALVHTRTRSIKCLTFFRRRI